MDISCYCIDLHYFINYYIYSNNINPAAQIEYIKQSINFINL